MIAGCTHPGPYRAVQGTLGDSARGDCAVVCCGCGGFQRPAAGRLDREVAEIMRSHVSVSDPWFGTRMDLTTLPDGAGMRILSAPTLDLIEAHRAAQRGATAEAEQRRDAGWFIGLALVPPWLESKRDEDSGDLLVRPRVGWEPSTYEPVDVHAPCAPRPPDPVPLPAAPPTVPISCRRCGCVARRHQQPHRVLVLRADHHEDSMTKLDLDAPIRSLRALAGLSIRALATALGLAAHNAVAKAEKAGDGIELRTVRRYAAACGYDVSITLTRKKP